jgi:hypothetical protein
MNAKLPRVSVALLFATAFSAAAHAEYRCDPAPSWMDQRACEAADKSPETLRRFVQRMDYNRVNLKFSDYVSAATVRAWEEQNRQIAALSDPEALKVARSGSR